MALSLFLQSNWGYGLFIFQSLLALAIVLAGTWLLLRLFRKWQDGQLKKNPGSVEIVERHSLGPKTSIAVVRFDGRRFMLGISEGGITLLHEEEQDDSCSNP